MNNNGRPPTHGTMCTRCRERWSQSKLGLCRRCERETNVDGRSLVEREAEHIAKMQAQERARLARAGKVQLELPATYTIVVDGVEYDVINDRLGFGRACAQPRPQGDEP